MPTELGTRRQPKQERSRLKVESILDAAEQLLIEAGYDALTTTAVSERSGVAVGSLYQYFHAIDDIVDGMMARCAERFADRLEVDLIGATFTRKRDAANAALDSFVAFYRKDRVLRVLRTARPLGSVVGFGPAADRIMGVVAEALVGQGLASEVDEHFALEVEVQWATAEALVLLAFRRDADGDPVVLAHLRRLFDLDVEEVG